MSAPLNKSRPVVLAAGGTGGHLFPAEALAVALRARGERVILATDARVDTIAKGFPAESMIRIPSATPSGRSPVKRAQAALILGGGVLRAALALRSLKPAIVVGFGGYPTVPPILAASLLGFPTLIHEQNGVMGRANRFLAGRTRAIATGFKDVAGMPAGSAAKATHTGNPVRPAVLEAAETPFPGLADGGTLRLLAFGGSQGARVMSDVVPPAIAALAPDLRARLHVTQQARAEDIDRVRETYARLGVAAEIEPFFKDLPGRIAASHLVIARSGASTVAELGVIGRPAILVPLPGAIDQDQAANAKALSSIGAATVLPQSEFTPERLASELTGLLAAPGTLTRQAVAAKSAGIADAAERLASLVIDLISSERTSS